MSDLISKLVNPDRSVSGFQSKFLDELYSDKEHYQRVKDSIYKYVIEKFPKESVPCCMERRFLDFPKLDFLSPAEETVVAAAILEMAKKINRAKYVLGTNVTLINFKVSDVDRNDVPMPDIELTIRCPVDEIPMTDKPFYFKGIFTKDKVYKEIVKAKITHIAYQTSSGAERFIITL